MYFLTYYFLYNGHYLVINYHYLVINYLHLIMVTCRRRNVMFYIATFYSKAFFKTMTIMIMIIIIMIRMMIIIIYIDLTEPKSGPPGPAVSKTD